MEEEIQREIGNYQHLPKVFLVGSEGSGKTTLFDSLLDKPIKISNDNPREGITLEIEEMYSGDSCTNKPSLKVDDQHRFILCDCTSFDEIRSQDIYSKIFDYLNKLPNNKIILFLVMSQSEIERLRINPIGRLIESVKKYFKNIEQLKNGLGIVITKSDMEKDEIMFKLNESQRENEWARFFVQNPDRVFVMPKPSKKDIGKNYTFNDKDRMIHFINSLH